MADIDAYERTLRKLEALHLPITTIIAGHWAPVQGPELIERNLALPRALPRPARGDTGRGQPRPASDPPLASPDGIGARRAPGHEP